MSIYGHKFGIKKKRRFEKEFLNGEETLYICGKYSCDRGERGHVYYTVVLKDGTRKEMILK